MGEPPAVVIIVRHGARIDAVDRQWHLTSATPYDPPLTYGGWKQSQALGSRIASILHQRGSTADADAELGQLKNPSLLALDDTHDIHAHMGSKPIQRRRQRQRVIVHSSPFLRCIQTSIGISAGLKQYEAPEMPTASSQHLKIHHPHPMHSGSPHIRARDNWNSPHLSAIPEPDEGQTENQQEPSPNPWHPLKPRLRLDAFLGEWLSPEYFEMITTPPDSVMMIAGAKADLLRLKQVDTTQVAEKHILNHGNFPGGWESNNPQNSHSANTDGPLGKMGGLGQSLPRINRSNSHDGYSSSLSRAHHDTQELENHISPDLGGYKPLVPAYAISSSDAIPPGYVAHARDACIDIDYQWDSMRMPHDWGDGGQVGEEWSSMHKRFRRGLQGMIHWYRNCDAEERQTLLEEEGPSEMEETSGDDGETDIILILVTHGAGCNALIGALSNQPVLLDVAMASLTMAIRKDGNKLDSTSSEASVLQRGRSVVDTSISDEYQVKMIASTEHIRQPPRTSNTSSSQQSPMGSSPFNSSRRHGPGSAISTASSNSTLNTSFHLDDLESDEKNWKRVSATSGGLWTKPVVKPDNQPELPPDRETRRQFAQSSRRFRLRPRSQDENAENRTPIDFQTDRAPEVDDSGRFATHGLWGAPPHALGTAREKGPKRRWTHSEQR